MRYRFVRSWTDRCGRTYVYFLRHGRRIRLPDEIDSPEFIIAYTAAMNEAPLAALPLPAWPRKKRTPLIGVYLLMLCGQVVYVGSSLNMPHRVAAHRSNGRPFDHVFYIATTANQRGALERALIRQIDPRQNRAGRSNGKSTESYEANSQISGVRQKVSKNPFEIVK